VKSLKIAIGLFIALLLTNIYMFNYLKETVTSVSIKIEAAKLSAADEDFDKTMSILHEIQNDIDQYQNIWHIMVNHGEVDEVQTSIARCLGYGEKQNFNDVLANLYELEFNIGNLLEREYVNISNIF